MVQGISVNISGIERNSQTKANNFTPSVDFNNIMEQMETRSAVQKDSSSQEKSESLDDEFKKLASELTICDKCCSIYIGKADICSKCGNDLEAQRQKAKGLTKDG